MHFIINYIVSIIFFKFVSKVLKLLLSLVEPLWLQETEKYNGKRNKNKQTQGRI